MSANYILLGCFDRKFDTPILFDTLAEAQSAMKKALIGIMFGLDDSVFNDYTKDEDYSWEPDGYSAWFTNRHGNSNWEIYEFDEILRQSALQKKDAEENEDFAKLQPLMVAFTVKVTTEDIDDIMCAALEGGINHWCSKVEVVGEYLGTYAHEQIPKGGSLLLHDSDDKQHELTRDKFMKGLRLFLSGYSNLVSVEDNRIDPGDFNACYADMVVQLALFGEVVYG